MTKGGYPFLSYLTSYNTETARCPSTPHRASAPELECISSANTATDAVDVAPSADSVKAGANSAYRYLEPHWAVTYAASSYHSSVSPKCLAWVSCVASASYAA